VACAHAVKSISCVRKNRKQFFASDPDIAPYMKYVPPMCTIWKRSSVRLRRDSLTIVLRGHRIGQCETYLTSWRNKMNAKKLTAAVILFAATGAALAQSSEFVAPDANFISSKSRAEVVAELNQARTEGLLTFTEYDYPAARDHAGVQSPVAKHAGVAQSSGMANTGSNIYFGS
jgi:hypothetical protein